MGRKRVAKVGAARALPCLAFALRKAYFPIGCYGAKAFKAREASYLFYVLLHFGLGKGGNRVEEEEQLCGVVVGGSECDKTTKTMMLEIREEEEEDIEAIRKLNQRVFGRPNEAELVDKLREKGAVVLSLVAIEDDVLVGHVLFSSAAFQWDEHNGVLVALGPIAISNERQGKGIGSILVNGGIERLRDRGHDAIAVVGKRNFFRRLGFRLGSAYWIKLNKEVPEDTFMILELKINALFSRQGTVAYQPEFDQL